jgi:hypothetical protein
VRFKMMAGGVLGVLHGMEMVGMGHVRVVRGGLVVAVEMLLGGFPVMACSVLVMLRCLGVMMGCLTGHGRLLSLRDGIGFSTPKKIIGGGARREITAGRMRDENSVARAWPQVLRCNRPGQTLALREAFDLMSWLN